MIERKNNEGDLSALFFCLFDGKKEMRKVTDDRQNQLHLLVLIGNKRNELWYNECIHR